MSAKASNDQIIHFIGVGGVGMSALAQIMLDRGYSVSGSEQTKSKYLENLFSKGLNGFNDQNAKNIETICQISKTKPLIIKSSAISQDNEELKAAQKAKLEIWHRSDLLAKLIKEQPSIAVTGTHGKTTTSTILTTLLALTGNDPTAIVGGLIPLFNSNSHSGKGKFLIAEGDESDGTITKYYPELGVVTNLELDHVDHYSGIDELLSIFKEFKINAKKLLVNHDCPNLKLHFKEEASWSIKTYENINYAAIPVKRNSRYTIAKIYENGQFIDNLRIPLPGLHNLSNAIGAFAACRIAGISFGLLKKAMRSVETPKRRFEFRGTWKNRIIIDDYAHHPSEINATMLMAREIINNHQRLYPIQPKRLFAIFQPHRYSRTSMFLKDFASTLSNADIIILTPIYAASEEPIANIDSNLLGEEIHKIKPSLTIMIANNLSEIPHLIKKNSKEQDLILAMGAGNINNLWSLINNQIKIDPSLTNLMAS